MPVDLPVFSNDWGEVEVAVAVEVEPAAEADEPPLKWRLHF